MKGNKIPVQRIIYDNYDLSGKYPDKELKDMAVECEWITEEEKDEVSDQTLWDWRYEQDACDWDDEKAMLTDFFQGKTVMFTGKVGLWHGVYSGGKVGEFWDLFNNAMEDCNYCKLYDENGHMYLTCSHHDGTNNFEIKILTDKGIEYFNRWDDSYDDDRTERHIHDQIYKHYSVLPNFAHKIYGCDKRAYEPITKGRLVDMINDRAKSFYS